MPMTHDQAEALRDECMPSEAVTSALIWLSRANVPPDIQALLVYGNPEMGVGPGALEQAIRAVMPRAALASPAPAGGERYRHKKRGSTYRVVGTAHLQCQEDPLGGADGRNSLSDGDEMMVYQSEAEGSLWVRSTDEFNDGRFEKLPAPITPPPSPDVAGVVESIIRDACELVAEEPPEETRILISTDDLSVILTRHLESLPPDVVELVIAARIVAYEDQSKEALRDLDKAAEAFSERVPWENDPEELRALTPKDGSR